MSQNYEIAVFRILELRPGCIVFPGIFQVRGCALHNISGLAHVGGVLLSIAVLLVFDDINDRKIVKKIFVGFDVLISVGTDTVILFAKVL